MTASEEAILTFLRAFLIVLLIVFGLVIVFAAFGPTFMIGWD